MASDRLGMEKTLANTSFDDAKTRVTAALKEEGFGVLTEIDVKQTLKTKIDVDFRPYTILGACNPQLAHRALQVRDDVGLLLPCNVVVSAEGDGAAKVSILDPQVMTSMAHEPALEPIMKEARERLQRVLDAL